MPVIRSNDQHVPWIQRQHWKAIKLLCKLDIDCSEQMLCWNKLLDTTEPNIHSKSFSLHENKNMAKNKSFSISNITDLYSQWFWLLSQDQSKAPISPRSTLGRESVFPLANVPLPCDLTLHILDKSKKTLTRNNGEHTAFSVAFWSIT